MGVDRGRSNNQTVEWSGGIGSINTYMPYHIYQTTNQINHKYYIGVTNGSNPNYLGSGTALINAIKEHGKHNFKREILETYDTEAEAFKREAEIVNEAFVKDRNTYNMKVGDSAAWGSLRATSIGVIYQKRSKHYMTMDIAVWEAGPRRWTRHSYMIW